MADILPTAFGRNPVPVKWIIQTAVGRPSQRLLRCFEPIPADTYLFRLPVDLCGYAISNTDFVPVGVEGVLIQSLAFPVQFAANNASRRVYREMRLKQELAPIDAEIATLIKTSDAEMLAMDITATTMVATAGDLIDLTVEKHDDSRLTELRTRRSVLIDNYEHDLATHPVVEVKPIWGFHLNRQASRVLRHDGLLEPDEVDAKTAPFVDAKFITDPFGDMSDIEMIYKQLKTQASTITINPVVYCVIQGKEVAISKLDFETLRAFNHTCYVRCTSAKHLPKGDHVIQYVQPRQFYARLLEVSTHFGKTRNDRLKFMKQWEELEENKFVGIQHRIAVGKNEQATDEDAAKLRHQFERQYESFNEWLQDEGIEG
jgi:hypothetical protein